MKKSILICGLALVGFTSCKKSWTCQCTFSTTGGKLAIQLLDQTKGDAKTQCQGHEDTYNSIGSVVSCEIK